MFDEILSAVGVKDLSTIQEMMLTVVAGKTVVVTNMLGILELSDQKIVIKATKMQKVAIIGECLEVVALNKNDLTVRGRIIMIDYHAE